jgi:hypothetical protein
MFARFVSFCLVTVLIPVAMSAQNGDVDITGTWRADTPDGPREVIVRPDSSASVGEEMVRWRLAADTVLLAFGDEWVAYQYALSEHHLTLSGGDLEEPVTLTHIGPPTPRPEGVPVPPAPPADRRATL